MRPQLVTATVELYNAIRAELLPTPNKSHYTFNLRDLGKVVQGLMRADPKTLGTQEQVRAAGCSTCQWCAHQCAHDLALNTLHVCVDCRRFCPCGCMRPAVCLRTV